ncbi:MAG: HD domain-containing protein [Candidatus Anstonellales archaeon]
MYIKDALHWLMRFTEDEQKVIDSSSFQRLRKVKQLSFVDLVYPGANHTRFSHSLGTSHLAGMVASSLGLDVGLARLKGLLHDIGHPPFSHTGEEAISELAGSHEKLGEEIIKDEIAPLIPNYSLKELLGRGVHEEIISCGIGVDRLDYLHRDAYYTGVSYGVIELDRMIETMVLSNDGKLCIDPSGLESLEAFMLARFFMFSAVYQHRVVRIASEMAKRAIVLALEEGMDPHQFARMGDEQAYSELLKYSGREYVQRILGRKLYKGVLEIGREFYSDEIAAKVRDSVGCDVIVSVPSMKQDREDVFVLDSGEPKNAKEFSDFIKVMGEAGAKRKKVIIAVPPEFAEKARSMKSKFLA